MTTESAYFDKVSLVWQVSAPQYSLMIPTTYRSHNMEHIQIYTRQLDNEKNNKKSASNNGTTVDFAFCMSLAPSTLQILEF